MALTSGDLQTIAVMAVFALIGVGPIIFYGKVAQKRWGAEAPDFISLFVTRVRLDGSWPLERALVAPGTPFVEVDWHGYVCSRSRHHHRRPIFRSDPAALGCSSGGVPSLTG